MTTAAAMPETFEEKRAAPRRRAWFTLILLLLLYMCSMLDRNIINVLVLPIQKEFGIGDFEMGLLLGPAFGLSYVILAFPLAWLGDRWSRRGVAAIGVVVWSLSNIAAGLSASFETLFLARIGVGAGEAALLPAAYVLIAQLFPQRGLALALSIFSMGTIAGMGVGYGFGGWLLDLLEGGKHIQLIGHVESWRLVFFITGVPSLVLAGLLYFVPEKTRAQTGGKEASDVPLLPFLRRNPWSALGLPLAFSMASLSSAALLMWLPAYTMPAFGWSATAAGAAVAGLLIIPATIGKIGSGLFVDWLFARGVKDAHPRYLMFALMIAGPCAIAAFFVGATPFIALLAIWFMLAYPVQGYGAAAIQLVTPEALRGRMSAIFTILVNIMAAGVAPTMVGYLSEYTFSGSGSLGLGMITTVATWVPLTLLLLWKVLPMTRLAVEQHRQVEA